MVRVGWLNEGCMQLWGTGKNARNTVRYKLTGLVNCYDEIVEWIPYEDEIPENAVYNETDGYGLQGKK